MAHVRRTDNGRWEVRYRAGDGRERARRFRTRKAARDHLARISIDQHQGTWIDPARGWITLRRVGRAVVDHRGRAPTVEPRP